MIDGKMTVHFDIDLSIPSGKTVIWIEAGVFEVRARRQLANDEVVKELNEWAAGGGMLWHEKQQQDMIGGLLSDLKKEAKK